MDSLEATGESFFVPSKTFSITRQCHGLFGKKQA